MSALLAVSIVGLWASAVYEPTAIVFLSRQAAVAFGRRRPADHSVRARDRGEALPD
jgi:hypothetical protein